VLGLLYLSRLESADCNIDDISEYLGSNRTATAAFLSILRKENLVRSETERYRQKYSLTPRGIRKAEEIESRINSRLMQYREQHI